MSSIARHPWDSTSAATPSLQVAEREHGLAEHAHQAAKQHYEIANARALHAISFPARLVPGRAESEPLTLRGSEAFRVGPRLPGFGPERHGPTIER